MFDAVADLDAPAALARARERREAADRAEAELLGIAAHWADLHAVIDRSQRPDEVTVSGVQELMPLAGEGTPEVAEFAPAELAATLGMSTWAGQRLVGDALEMRHRLPRIWARIMAGSLQPWRGRKIAERTRWLSVEAAAWVDAHVAPFAHKIGPGRVAALVDAATIRFDPDAADERARRASDARGVWVSDELVDGTRSIRIEADALDAAAFDNTVDDIATSLSRLGDTDHQDVRRAKAVGVIAAPQAAFELLGGCATAPHGPGPASCASSGIRGGDMDSSHEDDVDCLRDEASIMSADVPGPGPRDLTSHRPRVVLYLHLSEEALRDGHGVGRAEGLGPVSASQIRDWVGRTDVTVRPVQDLADRTSVDAYEVPERMRERVLLRNPCCPFPWCDNLSRRKDMDHVEAFRSPDDGGPPGQTHPGNLAPLCRRHHRIKTHGGWSLSQPEPGQFHWRSPRGHRYLVDHTGTTALPTPA